MSKLTSIAASTRPADPAADEPRPVDEADLLAAAVLRAERRMAALAEVTRIGLSLMGSLERRVLATDAAAFDPSASKRSVSDSATAVPPIFEEPAAAFAKLSRSVRLTVDLEAKADEALQRLRRGEAAALTAQRVAREKGPTMRPAGAKTPPATVSAPRWPSPSAASPRPRRKSASVSPP